MKQHTDDFRHPYDTLVSSSLRFVSELIAWVAGPWALSLFSNWLIFPTLTLLVAVPAIFSTRNDKRKIVISTPGPVRAGLELLLYTVAVVAPWFVWSTAVSGVAVGIVIASLARMDHQFENWVVFGYERRFVVSSESESRRGEEIGRFLVREVNTFGATTA